MDLRLVVLATIIGLAQCKLIDLSCHEIRQFVNGHNSRRLEVANGKVPGQPGAEKMKSVIWDEELAAKATDWASKNPSGHNPDRKIRSGKYTTGENIYWYSTTNPSYKFDVDSALQGWFDEHKDYTFGPLKGSDFTSTKQIGHYTQMIWSDSTRIGCGLSEHSEGAWKKFTVVCNYGPNGNWIGQDPYRRGQGNGKLVCGTDDCSRPYGNKC